jgi:hypothetical protein
MRRTHPWLGLGVAVAVYAVLAFVLFHDAWLTPGQIIAGSGNDPPMFAWYLQWTPWAISHGHNPLVTDYLVYPGGANMMWNTSLVLPALVLWPVTAAFGSIVTFNTLMTLAPIASATVAFLALRRHASQPAAGIGAAVYAFSPILVAHDQAHAQFAFAVIPPLALMLMEDIITAPNRRRRIRAGVLLGIASTAQFLIGSELLAITGFGIIVGLAVLALIRREQIRAHLRGLAAGLGAAVVTFLVTASIPLVVLFFGPQRISGPIQPPGVFVQDLVGLVVPGPNQVVSAPNSSELYQSFIGNAGESSGYFGVLLLAALGIFVWLRRDRILVRWAAVVAAVLVIFALGPALHVAGHLTHVPFPWRLFQWMPLLNNIVPARFIILSFLLVGLLVAVLIDDVARLPAVSYRFAAGAALTAVAVSLVPKPIPVTAIQTPPFFVTAAVDRIAPGDVAVVIPYKSPAVAMVWQAQSGMRFRMPSGRIFTPLPSPHLGPPPSPLTNELFAIEAGGSVASLPPAQRSALLADMRRMHVTSVVIGPTRYTSQMVAFFSQLLEQPPQEVAGVVFWGDVRP